MQQDNSKRTLLTHRHQLRQLQHACCGAYHRVARLLMGSVNRQGKRQPVTSCCRLSQVPLVGGCMLATPPQSCRSAPAAPQQAHRRPPLKCQRPRTPHGRAVRCCARMQGGLDAHAALAGTFCQGHREAMRCWHCAHLRWAEAGNWTRAKAVGRSTLLLRRSSGRVQGSATVSMSPVKETLYAHGIHDGGAGEQGCAQQTTEVCCLRCKPWFGIANFLASKAGSHNVSTCSEQLKAKPPPNCSGHAAFLSCSLQTAIRRRSADRHRPAAPPWPCAAQSPCP